MDCMVERKRSLWEVSAGAVLLVRELARANSAKAKRFMQPLFELLQIDNFKEADRLHTVVLEQLPAIFETNGGTRIAKAFLDEFAEMLHR